MSKNVQKTTEKKLIGYKTHKLGLNKILSLGSLISHESGKKKWIKIFDTRAKYYAMPSSMVSCPAFIRLVCKYLYLTLE